MRALPAAAVAVAVAAAACSVPPAGPPQRGLAGPPVPTAGVVAAAVLGADSARAAALAWADAAPLAGVFAGDALAELQARVRHLRLRRERDEREVVRRRIVHWSGAAGVAAAVLEITSRTRIVGLDGPTRWDPDVEQWEADLRWAGRWVVDELHDLAPSAWWPD